ncbi:YeeE/YedE thiosulfate transporter family protein [Luteitalea sp.]|uniref:YeeE/YedE thiosulfate transporter family protein n=1 Tax=Luteitalea sp. TaxID=2004800 RepID=UPI0037CA4ECD
MASPDLDARVERYIDPYLAGALLGLVLFAAYALTGTGLGASGAINRVQLSIVKVVAPSHVDTVKHFAATAGGSRQPLVDPSVGMLLGTVLGGVISGLLHGRMRVEVRKGPRARTGTRLALAFLGGGIMGFGARLARGCTSGQALSGGAVLSVGSFAFMFSIFGSAYALAWFLRRQWT